MKIRFAMLCLWSCWMLIGTLSAQHEIETRILKNASTTRSSFYNLTHVTWGSLYKDQMLLQRLEAGESGALDFSIQYFSNVDLQIGLELDNANQDRYAFHFVNGEVFINGINYGACGQGTNYRLERCDASIKYYRDGQLFTELSLTDNQDHVLAFVEVATADLDNAEIPNLNLQFPLLNTCEATEVVVATAAYADLQKRPDGAFVQLSGPNLRFRYYEPYATPTSLNDQLTYTISQSDGVVVQSGSLDKSSGENKMQIGLTSFNQMYLLEVEDGKGEKYYLRFFYFCADPPNCPIANNGGGGN